MKTILKPALASVFLLCIAACSQKPRVEARYQLDPVNTPTMAVSDLPPLHLRVEAPAWLDQDNFYYRLHFDDPNRLRRYTENFWIDRPAALLEERLRSIYDSTQNRGQKLKRPTAILTVQLHDFTQQFLSPNESNVRIMTRARLVDAQTQEPIAQRLFILTQPAPTPDAAGGAKALSTASDQLARDIIEWVKAQSFLTTIEPKPATTATP